MELPDRYAIAVEHLVGDRPSEAVRWFASTADDEGSPGLGHAGLAVALADLGAHQAAIAAIRLAEAASHDSRREAHHVAIVSLLVRGELGRGTALAREHLLDFPSDTVVRHALRTAEARSTRAAARAAGA